MDDDATNGDGLGGDEPVAKRRKTTGRRKTACQTCSLRKVKCDNARPACLSCQTTGSDCHYLSGPEEDTLTLNQVVDILGHQIQEVANRLDNLPFRPTAGASHNGRSSQLNNILPGLERIESIDHQGYFPSPEHLDDVVYTRHNDRPEPSRDFSHIPPHKTTADEVLTWPIFEDAYPPDYFIDAHLGYKLSTGGSFVDEDVDLEHSILPSSNSIAPLDEHRIPALVDRFLENVHTKNPILDVEALVQKSREHASRGLGWDGYSCLLLMTCALGLVAKPFGSEIEAIEFHYSLEQARNIAAPAREKEQGDCCFVQAARRLGGLRPSIIAAQCYFFAGVYLMYTLRPMLASQYFHQASITFQLYLKMQGRVSRENVISMQRPLQSSSVSPKSTRLEQRLYWSCFKSEAEFRVELPLPQTEIADYDFPDLFPSPPSPLPIDNAPVRQPSRSLSISHILSTEQDDEVKLHAKRLCNEEESWYYYLTELALRRIGNRVINTFFQQDRGEWMNISRFLDVAIEFEAQVSTWQTNLPPAMQKYETDSMIRAPRIVSPGGAEAGFVSQELSWATENRLLEMRQWLYQPFLYYLIHARPTAPPTEHGRQNSFPQSIASPSSITGNDHNVFWTLIARAIDCNLTILETRSLPHRHHGLWFDLRAVMCSSLILLAVVKSGYAELIPDWRQTLVGHTETDPGDIRLPDRGASGSPNVRGKFGRVLRQLGLWSQESQDMIRAREVLETLIHQVIFAH